MGFARWKSIVAAPAGLAVGVVASGNPANGDEGGVSYWLPGEFGSLSAAPLVPGWAVGIINVYESVSASGNIAAAREVTIGNLNPNAKVNLNLNLSAHPDLVLVDPAYVFATKVFGGQLAVSMGAAAGRSSGELDGTLTVAAGPLTATRQGQITDARYGFSDLYPETSLRWNSGVHSWMFYAAGDIPVGTYDSTRLANLGVGHGAIDGGAGYTYFDQKNEFSVVTGMTYNFINPSTDYQNGIDWHIDWGASQFVTKTIQVGLVGYFFRQLTADRGAAAFLGENLTQVAGIGPQFGLLFPAGSMQGYLNLKAYAEFAAENRAAGFNAWVTLSFSPKPPEAETHKARMFTK